MKKLALFLLTFGSYAAAFAQDAAQATAGTGSEAMFAIGGGLAIGVAALGATLGQGRIGSSAMEGIARNPQARQDMFIPMILGLVFIESILIFSFVIAFLIVNKIG